MTAATKILDELRPTKKERLIDLVERAGIDTSDWANCKGGHKKAASNPKYCYDWSFGDPGNVCALTFWHHEIHEDNDILFRHFDLPETERNLFAASQKLRALHLEQALLKAWRSARTVRAIIMIEKSIKNRLTSSSGSRTSLRKLDPIGWAVTECDPDARRFKLVRGATPIPIFPDYDRDFEEVVHIEGRLKRMYIAHRQRERQMRDEKIAEFRRRHAGRLYCEVEGCRFDFSEHYGSVGEGYAQVHHKIPLSESPDDGREVRLDDLAIVCADCHAMIHRGGKCRSLDGLIVAQGSKASTFPPSPRPSSRSTT